MSDETNKDSWIASAIWGRIGAAILSLIVFALGVYGYNVSPEDAKNVEGLITGILAGVGAVLAIISKVRESKKASTESLKIVAYLVLIPLLVFGTVSINGCLTIGATGPDSATARGVPWYEDIQNWTTHQRANFFIDVWLAENANYKVQNAVEKKSPELIKYLRAKREALEASRIPVRLYASLVKSGGVPDQDIELQIIAWIRQLQLQMLQKGGS